jgi:hypothetical protein
LVGAGAGGFFIAVGVGTGVLALAWLLPGPMGALLRRPLVSLVILAAIILMMGITVFLGILNYSP